MRYSIRDVTFVIIFLVFAVLALISASRTLRTFDGEIDYAMVRKAKFATMLPGDLYISSNGGDASAALEFSKLIVKRSKAVHIEDMCISACAEFIIPSASRVYVSKKTLIGYHISDFIVWSHLPINLRKDYCGSKRYAWLHSAYSMKGLNTNFYQEIDRRLEFKISDAGFIYDGGSCYEVNMTSSKSIWFPNSDQLRDLLNINFSGNICSDDEICWRSRLQHTFPHNAKYVVGNQEFTHGQQAR